MDNTPCTADNIIMYMNPFMNTVNNIKNHKKHKPTIYREPKNSQSRPQQQKQQLQQQPHVKPQISNKPTNMLIDSDGFRSPISIDSLFWCIFIIHNGEFEYDIISRGKPPALSVLKNQKIEFISVLREKYKSIVKPLKLDSLANIEAQLIHDTAIVPTTAIAVCAINKHNICYISNKKFHYMLISNDTSLITIIRQNISGKGYSYKTINIIDLPDYTANTVRITNLNSPLLRISAYLLNDLIDLCVTLNLPTTDSITNKKFTKPYLYDQLTKILL